MALTITIPNGLVQLTGNPVYITVAGGSVPVGSTGYKLLLKVTSTDGKLKPVPPDGIVPVAGSATFDISGYVDQPVTAVFQWPLSGIKKEYATQAFNITVEAGEYYIDSDGEEVETWSAVTEDMQLLKGGLSPRQVAALRDAGSDFYTAYIIGGKWLTARPQSEKVHPTQPVKLWYLPATDNTVNFRVKGFYDDGTDDTVDTEVILDPDKLYEFNCNPAQSGLELEPTGKRMLYFDVSLVGESETRRFVFDWTYCERPVFLMFANTFGGVDDVFFSGYLRDGFNTQGETSNRPPQITDTVFTPTLINVNRTGQNRWVVNTGWKSITELQFYRDLLISKQAWFLYRNITQTTTSIIPVIIDAGDFTLFDRKEDLYSLEIAFSEAHVSMHSFDNRIF